MKLPVILATVLMAASPAVAQVLEPPARPNRPIFGSGQAPGNRTTQSLFVNASLLGGYSHNNVDDASLDPGTEFRPSSYTGSGSVGLAYGVGSSERGFNASGTWRADRYGNFAGGGGPIYGGGARAGVRTTLGRRGSLSASQSYSRDPYISFGLFNNSNLPGATLLYDPEGNPVNGVIDGDTVKMDTNVTATRSLSRRVISSFGYSYLRTEYTGNTPFTYDDHAARVDLSTQVGRTGAVHAAYNISAREAQEVIAGRRLVHGFTGGFSVDRRVTRTRSVTFAAGGGGEYVNGDPADYWSPTFYGSVGIDLGQSWNLSLSYRQSSTELRSPLLTSDSYLLRSGIVSAGGYLNNRVELVLVGGVSSGSVAADNSLSGVKNTFSGYTGSAQLRLGITNWWSAVVSANVYQSDRDGFSNGLQNSGSFRTNSIRVGLSWSVPLYSPRTPRS